MYKKDEGEISHRYRIVDDRNIDKPTLAKRRLDLLSQKVPLARLSKAVFFLGDLIMLAKGGTWFIDSSGNVFEYKKTKMVPLMFKKITKVLYIPTGGTIIELEGIPSRFKTLYAPRDTEKWAGVLNDGMGYILYGLYEEKFDITKRMI